MNSLRIDNSLLVTAAEEEAGLLSDEGHHLGVGVGRCVVDVDRDPVGLQGAVPQEQVTVILVPPDRIQASGVNDSDSSPAPPSLNEILHV